MNWLAYVFLLLGLSWAGIGMYRAYAVQKGLLDEPNARSSHQVVTPRGGGMIFALLWLCNLGVMAYQYQVASIYVYLFAPGLLIAGVGFIDDLKKGISAKKRLFVQIVACALTLWVLHPQYQQMFPGLTLPKWAFFLFTLIGMVWMVNLTNFMDGIDGIAATQGLFFFGLAAFVLMALKAYGLALLAIAMLPLLVGFLFYNWPRASLFMGDSGSGFLGFLFAVFALVSMKWFHLSIYTWLIITSLFWFDATVTLIRRILAGEKWTEAHCLHAYQRLVKSGWSHLQVLMGVIVVNGILTLFALWTFYEKEMADVAFACALLFLTVVYILVEIQKPMFRAWHRA